MKIRLVKVRRVRALPDYRLEVMFSDGMSGVADLIDFVMADGSVVQPLRDPGYFAEVFLELGVPTWPNGCDIDAIALHMRMEEQGLLRAAAAAE